MDRPTLYAAISRRALATAQKFAGAYGDANRNSLVRITRPYSYNKGDGTYGRYAPATVVYADADDPELGAPAGVTPSQGPMIADFSSEPLAYDSITAYLPISLTTEPVIDDLVEIQHNPDRSLIGRVYRITGVSAGGRLTSSTQLSCTGLAPTKETSWR